MDLFEAITTRHSIPKVRPDPVPRELIEKMLSAAVQAPNHHRVLPWRFIVIQGDARVRLGEAFGQALRQRKPEALEAELEKERSRTLRAPVLIAVAVEKPVEAKVLEIENVCAAAAAVENMLLAANALGLGAMWRTGPAATSAEVKSFLGIEADQHIIAFVYVGYPDGEVKYAARPGYEERTTWLA